VTLYTCIFSNIRALIVEIFLTMAGYEAEYGKNTKKELFVFNVL